MCLILVKEPTIRVDPDSIENAVINNPDGWGYVIPDRGQLEIRRFYDGKDTNPEDVQRFLEEQVNEKVYLHLRFATTGSKSKENIHPFPILQKRKHGCQIMAMHNGTYSAYSPKGGDTRSDTQIFCQSVLTPLLERFGKNCSKKTLLQDPIVQNVLDKFNEGWSRLVLVDQWGNDLKLGEGEQKEGFWISNDYSFRPSYRKEKEKEKAVTKYYTPHSKTSQALTFIRKDSGWNIYRESHNLYCYKKESTKPYDVVLTRYGSSAELPSYLKDPYSGEDAIDVDFTECTPSTKRILANMGSDKKETSKPPFDPDEAPRSSAVTPPKKSNKYTNTSEAADFLDEYGLSSWDELFCLSREDLHDLCEDSPELMALCISGLLNVIYTGKEV